MNMRVLVVDSAARGQAMVDAFARMENVEAHRRYCDGEAQWHTSPSCEFTYWDLVLVHLGDGDRQHGKAVQVGARIYYGGGGAYDLRLGQVADTAPACIWRAISPDGVGSLTTSEAEELVQWARSDAKQSIVPRCCHAPAISYLCALSVLCEGYLAAHGDKSLPGFGGLSVAQSSSARARSTLTESSDWWLRGLGVISLSQFQTLLALDVYAGPQNPGGTALVLKISLYLRAARKYPIRAIQRLHRIVKSELDR